MAIETNGKTVVITGTSTGIGRATAQYLDQRGFRVIGTVRKEGDAEAVEAENSTNFKALLMDVARPESLEEFKNELQEELAGGGLWGLVNNAGMGFAVPLEFIPLDQLRALFEVNLFGLLAVTQICLPYLRQEKGRIVNISSTASIVNAPFHGPYSSAKSGLNSLSNSLRLELRPFGVQVSVIICGSVKTPIWQKGGEIGGQVWQMMPPEAGEIYGADFSQLASYFEKLGQKGCSPETVASTIHDALTSGRAKQTYYVGKDAGLFRILTKVPAERLRDWIILHTIGLDS